VGFTCPRISLRWTVVKFLTRRVQPVSSLLSRRLSLSLIPGAPVSFRFFFFLAASPGRQLPEGPGKPTLATGRTLVLKFPFVFFLGTFGRFAAPFLLCENRLVPFVACFLYLPLALLLHLCPFWPLLFSDACHPGPVIGVVPIVPRPATIHLVPPKEFELFVFFLVPPAVFFFSFGSTLFGAFPPRASHISRSAGVFKGT